MTLGPKPLNRLYVDDDLAEGGSIELIGNAAHYLANVLRARPGNDVLLFNGRDGEWRGRLESVGKRSVTAAVFARTRIQATEPDLWLAFAPLKKARTDFVVEKATELGVSRLIPVLTQYGDTTRVNRERLGETAREAAEQCERLSVPAVDEPVKLTQLLSGWPADRRLFCLIERHEATTPGDAFHGATGPSALLVGPEGGFSETEAQDLFMYDFTIPVSLGSRILRAETAAVAALACYQALAGDWR